MRLFVAIEPSAGIRDWAAASSRALAPLAPDVRWVSPEAAHLTLAFLGETPEERVASVHEAMARAAAAEPPFPLALGRLGAFESWRRVRVVWTGVDTGLEPLARIAAALRAGLEARGFALEKREYAGHLTLARSREARPQPGLEAASLPESPRMEVVELSLIRSRLQATGAEHEALWRCPLG